VQQRYYELAEDPRRLAAILAAGADKARAVARETLAEVKERMGFLPGQPG
jgi:tryptophanyl-tRNA synthetase